jgi:hypothetical protein
MDRPPSSTITLKLGDMRGFKLKQTFPFVYIASATFEHCVTAEDQRSCLRSAYKALRKGGVLAFDVSRPRRETASSWSVERKQLDGDSEVVRTVFSTPHPQADTVSVNLFFDVYRKGVLRERYYEYGEAKVSSKESLQRILTGLGFAVPEPYGDYDGSPYGAQSTKVIFVCHKT